jgi:hypothetical protein
MHDFYMHPDELYVTLKIIYSQLKNKTNFYWFICHMTFHDTILSQLTVLVLKEDTFNSE